jgi:hypothetical protein
MAIFDDGVQGILIPALFEEIDFFLLRCFGLGLQYLIEISLSSIFADHIGFPPPHYKVEDPIQHNDDVRSKGKVEDIVLERNQKQIVDEGHDDAAVVDQVCGANPLRLEGFATEEIDDH